MIDMPEEETLDRFRAVSRGLMESAEGYTELADRIVAAGSSPVYGSLWTRSERAHLVVNAQKSRDMATALYQQAEDVDRFVADTERAREDASWREIAPEFWAVLERQVREATGEEPPQ